MTHKNNRYALAQPKADEPHVATPATDESPRAQGVSPEKSTTTQQPTPYATTEAALSRVIALQKSIDSGMSALALRAEKEAQALQPYADTLNKYMKDDETLRQKAAQALAVTLTGKTLADITASLSAALKPIVESAASVVADRYERAARRCADSLQTTIQQFTATATAQRKALATAGEAAQYRIEHYDQLIRSFHENVRSESMLLPLYLYLYKGDRKWFTLLMLFLSLAAVPLVLYHFWLPWLWHQLCSLFT